MIESLVRNWWAIMLRGVVAVLFGIFVLARPAAGLATLIITYGAFAILGGLAAIYAAGMSIAHKERWGALLFEGILWVAAGVVAWVWPGITALALLFVIASWSIVIGVLNLVTAFRLRKVMEREWALGIAGALSIAFGILLFARPGAGALGVLWLIGIFALFYGILTIILGFEIHEHATRLRRRVTA